MNDDLDPLMVNVGDDIRAEDRNGVIRAIRRREFRAGPGVRIRRLDTHSIISYYGAPQTVISHAWKPRAGFTSDGKSGVLFSKGLVNGIEPVIGEKKISAEDCDPLAIEEFNDAGDCMLFVELKLNALWQIEKAEMKAYAKPEWRAWTARKLVAIAQEDGRIVPRARFDLGFYASERKATGAFRQWWWATS